MSRNMVASFVADTCPACEPVKANYHTMLRTLTAAQKRSGENLTRARRAEAAEVFWRAQFDQLFDRVIELQVQLKQLKEDNG